MTDRPLTVSHQRCLNLIGRSRAGSKGCLPLKQDGHRPVVVDLDQHVRTESTRLNRDTQLPQECCKRIHKWLSNVRRSSVDKTRPTSLLCVRKQGKLGNDNRFPTGVEKRTIHSALFVLKYPQLSALSSKPRHLVLSIPLPNTDEQHNAAADFGNGLSIDRYGAAANALINNFHRSINVPTLNGGAARWLNAPSPSYPTQWLLHGGHRHAECP